MLLNLKNLQFFSDNPPADPPGEKTFTQTELDDILAKRLARVKNEPPADYEEIKTKLKALQEKDLTEFDQIKQRLADKESHASKIEMELNDLKAKQTQEKIINAFKAAAQEAKIKYVDDAMKLTDMSTFTLGEDGKIEGLDDVVKKLAEEKPFLLSDENHVIGGASNPGGQERTVTQEQFKSMNYLERSQLYEKNSELYKRLNTN